MNLHPGKNIYLLFGTLTLITSKIDSEIVKNIV